MRFFPSGIAEGQAFCNRVEERELLRKYIGNVQHSVLIAPRRYGKSSLITQTLHDDHYHYVWIDFLSATTKEEVEGKIRTAVKELLLLLAPELKKFQKQAVDKVKSLSPELNLNLMGQTLTLHLTSDNQAPIDEMLTELDQYAQKINKRAVLVCDEFQQVSDIKDSQTVEALIRHAVERSKAITYVFSGSNRHMLQEMFSQSSRPLYRLCTVIQLDRIKEAEYIKFINHAARLRWKKVLNETLINKILELTECHTFYVNALCNELWLQNNPPATTEKIATVWQQYILRHKSLIISDIVPLALNQKKIVKALSEKPENALYGVDFAFRVKLNGASIRRAVESLLLKDIIYENAQGYYYVLDPAVSYYFRHIH